jgi:hypothetical protein
MPNPPFSLPCIVFPISPNGISYLIPPPPLPEKTSPNLFHPFNCRFRKQIHGHMIDNYIR